MHLRELLNYQPLKEDEEERIPVEDLIEAVLRTDIKRSASGFAFKKFLGKSIDTVKKLIDTDARKKFKYHSTLEDGRAVYHGIDSGGDHHFSIVGQDGNIDAHVNAIKQGTALAIEMAVARPGAGVHKLYHHLITKHNYILTGKEQSAGGLGIWQKMRKMGGVNVHGYHPKTGKAQHIDIVSRPELSHVGQYELDQFRKTKGGTADQRKKEYGDLKKTQSMIVVAHKNKNIKPVKSQMPESNYKGTLLKEGGNVFKDVDGTPLTARINKADVPATVKWLEKITKLDLTGKQLDSDGVPLRWLGSTGRQPTSGDVDLVVLTSDISKEELANRLAAWAKASGVPEDKIFNKGKDKNNGWIKVAGEVHFRTPIAGNPANGFVQTDFNFYASPELRDWGTFYQGGSSAGFKGMHRNVLLSSLAKFYGYKLGLNGLIDRETNQLVSLDPDRVAKIVLHKAASKKDLASVENIFKALEKDPKRSAKLADFVEFAGKEGLKLP